MSDQQLGEILEVADPIGVIPDNILGADDTGLGDIISVSSSDLNVSPIDLAAKEMVQKIGPFENFSNAFRKSLIAGTKVDLAELFGEHERATEISQKAERDLPTEGGIAEFLGASVGSIAPVIPALVAPVISLPLFAYYGMRAMGAGRGAVKAFEDISGEDVSAVDEALVSAGYGLAVLLTERMGLRNLRGVIDKIAPKALQKIAQTYATGSSKQTAKTILVEIAKVPGAGALREAQQEGLEKAATNLIDTYYGAKDINDLLQGVPEAVAMGAVGGGLIGGASIAIQSRNIRRELQKTGVRRDIVKSNPDIEQDEVSYISSFIDATADVRNITPKEAYSEIDLTAFRDEIDLLQRTARKSTVGAFISNSMPLFKRVVRLDDYTQLEERYGVEEGAKWRTKQSNKFRKELDKFIIGEEPSDGAPIGAFGQYQLWLANVSAHTFETGFFSDVKTAVITFIDQIHGSSEVVSNSPFDLQQRAKRKKFTKDWKEQFVDTFDTRAVFEREGAPNTGDAITQMASVQDLIQTKTEGMAQNLSRALHQNGYTGEALTKIRQQLPLILEDKKVFNSLPKEQRRSLQPAIDIWGKFRDDALQAYKEEGALDQGFFEDMKDRLKEQRLNAGRKGDQALLDKIDEKLEKIKGAKFVPIPYRMWFESLLINNPRKLNRVLGLLGIKERKTVFIRDLVEHKVIKLEDVDIFDIMGYYGARLSKDIGLLKIKNSGIDEGLIKPIEEGKRVDYRGGFVRAPRSAPVLKDMQLRGPLADFINEAIHYRNSFSIVDKGLALVKMGQFINFLFLPVYDVVQGMMLGAISPLRPIKTYKNIINAARDMYTHSDEWYAAGINGARSTPYPNPLASYNKMIEDIANHPNPIIRNLHGLLGASPLGSFRQAYNISWNTAWMLDGFIRQISYRHLTDDLGYSQKEAGRVAALYHADYASVPAATRRFLNKIFFTPTFKIAMSKLFTRMIKDSMSVSLKSGKLLAQKATGKRVTVEFNREELLHAASLGRTLGMITALHVVMTTFMGFEKDQWGRRYIKKGVETLQGVKDIVFTFSAPMNMFLKYIFRAYESFGDPAITRAFVEFAKKNSWELHPVWRIVIGLAYNERINGKPIAETLLDPSVRIARTMTWVMREASALVDEVVTSVSGQTDEAETRKVLQDEFGKLSEFVARMFVYSYLRTPVEAKQERQIAQIERIINEELGSIIDVDGNIPPGHMEQITKNAIDRMDKIIK